MGMKDMEEEAMSRVTDASRATNYSKEDRTIEVRHLLPLRITLGLDTIGAMPTTVRDINADS